MRKNFKIQFLYLNIFKWNFEHKGLIVVWIEGALFDTRLLLLQSLSVLHQGDLHVRIYF